MGEPSRPTLRQLREVYLLVGECCELGADPLAWRQRMSQGLLGLLGAQVVLYTETEQVAPFGERRFLEPRLLVDYGWPCESDRGRPAGVHADRRPVRGWGMVREGVHPFSVPRFGRPSSPVRRQPGLVPGRILQRSPASLARGPRPRRAVPHWQRTRLVHGPPRAWRARFQTGASVVCFSCS